MTAHVALVALTKRFIDGDRALVAVDDVSLELARGETTLLVGPSGSGKTTLLTLMAGLASPTSGEVHIDGERISRYREHHRTAYRRDHVGVVLQDLLLVPDLDALDNVLLPSVPVGVRAEDVARARALLARFGVAERARTRASRLSGGERQRIALARALLRSPSILLFDEPTAHLDDASTATFLAVLAEERDASRTIVVATHDPRVITGLDGARVVRMQSGRLVPS